MDRKEIQDQFGAHAAYYVTSKPHARGASLERLVELIQTKPEWRVLDIATGTGHTAFAFAPFVAHVWATDITEQMLRITRQQAQERGIKNLSVEFADAEDLPYPDDFFDLVTCRIAAHHFLDVEPFMQEAARVTRPGGTFAMVDNIVPEGSAGDYVNAFEKLRDPSHGRCLSVDEWLVAFNTAGFSLLHQEKLYKQMVFEDWAARHDVVVQRYLRAMLTHAPTEAMAFLEPHKVNEKTVFRLQEGIFVGQR